MSSSYTPMVLDVHTEAPDGGVLTRRVTVRYADRMVAEEAAPRHGIPSGEAQHRPMTMMALWAFCALQRGDTAVGDYAAFKAALLDVDPVEAPDAADVDPVRPTPEGQFTN